MIDEVRAAIHVTSIVGLVVAVTMLVPAALNLFDGDPSWYDLGLTAIVTATFWGLTALATRGTPVEFSARFGIILINALWWIVPVTAVVPLTFGPAGLGLADAVFETVSGFTTTGSTVLVGLDEMDRGTLLWRSMTQWFGGLGILSIGLIVLPVLNAGGMQLFRLESSDKSDKVLPSFVSIVKAITGAYLLMSVSCALAYFIAGMSVFDAINHAMTTMATGGFSTHDQSLGYYQNTAVLWVGSVFMILASLPFALYVSFLYWRRSYKRDPQIGWLLTIIASAAALVFLARATPGAYSFRALSEDLFDVISVISTTGFAAGDYTTWGSLSAPIFFILTFFGGCAGSTAGGLKTYRLILLGKSVSRGLRELVYPHGVFPTQYGGRRVDPAILRSAITMSTAFAAVAALGMLVLGAQGLDPMTALSGTVTALANVGPGLGDIIGPAGNFASLPDASKWSLSALMIAGRLEIIVVLALFLPALWR